MSGNHSADPLSYLPLTPVVFEIMLALADEERHGYAIMKEDAERTGGSVRLRPGTLYRAINRMLTLEFVAECEERPVPGSDDERRRYYSLTDLGRAVAEAEATRLQFAVSSAKAKRLLDSTEGIR